MKLDFTGEALNKPADLSLKAELGWDYLWMNNGCWSAVKTNNGAYIVTDEGCDLSNAFVFTSDGDLIKWLEWSAEDALSGDTLSTLQAAGWINQRLAFSCGADMIVNGILAALEEHEENPEKED